MKKIFISLLIIMAVLSTSTLAVSVDRVVDLGLIGQGGLQPDKYLSRAELATVAIRLVGQEGNLASATSSHFKDVRGWALPYINRAYDLKLVSGVSKDKFNPDGNVTYGQVLTILMRILAYEDGIDFKNYPEDYHSKALEIGLADLYTPFDKVINRGQVAEAIDRALDLKIKNEDYSLLTRLGDRRLAGDKGPSKDKPKIYIEDLSFNTSLIGVFSGRLRGLDNFSGYKLSLVSKSGSQIKSLQLGKDGSFSIEDFDIGIVTKLQGYKYQVFSPDGKILLENILD